MGDGTENNRYEPVLIYGALTNRNISSVASALTVTLGITIININKQACDENDGRLYMWGLAAGIYYTQFPGTPVNSTNLYSVPTQMNDTLLSGLFIKDVSAIYLHALVLTADNQIFAWGAGTRGELGISFNLTYSQIGNGLTYSSNDFVKTNQTGPLAGKTISKIHAGYQQSFIITTDGNCFAFGDNSSMFFPRKLMF